MKVICVSRYEEIKEIVDQCSLHADNAVLYRGTSNVLVPSTLSLKVCSEVSKTSSKLINGISETLNITKVLSIFLLSPFYIFCKNKNLHCQS
jgi:hypothetical protein